LVNPQIEIALADVAEREGSSKPVDGSDMDEYRWPGNWGSLPRSRGVDFAAESLSEEGGQRVGMVFWSAGTFVAATHGDFTRNCRDSGRLELEAWLAAGGSARVEQ
jgi:hypothetical protein